jgi:hypothetical protein
MNHTTPASRLRRIVPVIIVAVALPMLGGPAQAKDGEVVRRGSCSQAAAWKLKASPDDGRIEVEAEVDSNKTGQTWKWRLRHNGTVTSRGSATTSGASGSFEVHRTVVDLDGPDTLRITARNPGTGEHCSGTLTF